MICILIMVNCLVFFGLNDLFKVFPRHDTSVLNPKSFTKVPSVTATIITFEKTSDLCNSLVTQDTSV